MLDDMEKTQDDAEVRKKDVHKIESDFVTKETLSKMRLSF